MNDPLTQINDRPSFMKVLGTSVLKSNENKTKLALLLINVNRLQRINEIHGYKTGDESLKYLAKKLNEAKRPQDSVGRLSGSTFGLILFPIMNKGHAQLAAHKILRLLEIPLEYDNRRVNLDVAIGMSLCPAHSSLSTGLLKKAEDAIKLAHLQEAKLCITEDFSNDQLTEFWDLELGIEEAIINSEFELYYQPKIALKTGLPSGAEALIRWPHPSRGMIYPDQFIPVAEDHGHIKAMTIWILNVALRESEQWTNQWGKMHLSVNIPPNLMNEELVDLVENALNIWSPENVTLVLEILERSFALSNDDSFSTFAALQNLGTEISIDDFGTGYSALAYFKSIPAKELKIDKSFISNMLKEQGDYDIVTFIIKLAHAFNMHIVAEGVEDAETLAALKALGCDYIQGYVCAKPMPHSEFLFWLENYKIEEQAFAYAYAYKNNDNDKNINHKERQSPFPIDDKLRGKLLPEKQTLLEENLLKESATEDLSSVVENIAPLTSNQHLPNNSKNTSDTPTPAEPELIDINPLSASPIKEAKTSTTNNTTAVEIEIIDSMKGDNQSNKIPPTSTTNKNNLATDIDFGDTII